VPLKERGGATEHRRMPGTNERRSVVDEDGWEPMKPTRARLGPMLAIFSVALVVVPLLAFYATYLLLSR